MMSNLQYYLTCLIVTCTLALTACENSTQRSQSDDSGRVVQAPPKTPAAQESVSAAANAGLLLEAIRSGRGDEARRLIAAGADVRQADETGATPLFWASGMGLVDIVEDLLEKGAPIDAMMIYAGTPLHAAVVGGHKRVAEILIDHGATVDALGFSGTPLMDAAMAGSMEMVELLLEKGANVNAIDPNVPRLARSSALDKAVFSGNQDIIELLRTHGARSGRDLP